MLGDGSIGFTKGRDGKSATNARYSMTMMASSKPYMQFVLDRVYGVFSRTGLIPYPNTNLSQDAGKEVTQYYFATLSSPLFTSLQALWYRWSVVTGKYV